MKRIIIAIILAGLLAAALFAWQSYHKAFSVNTPATFENEVLLIPTGATLEDVIDSLAEHGQIRNEKYFRWTAGKMNYHDGTVRKGRYILPSSANSRTLINLLRSGRQTPLSVTIHEVRTIEQMCGRVGNRLEFDSSSLMTFIDQHFDTLAGTLPETRLTRFLPNTYEFYWTVTPEDFCKRMLKEHDRFWTDERKAKAEAAGLATEEVYILASIIEKETQYNPEKQRMAGVYLNRLRRGMPLQADPTVVFALGDFEIRRVLHSHLEVESPYNTYRYAGLPPGPVYMPGIASIDAVLDHEKHEYFFFCARPAYEGPGHAYAVTLRAHNENAARYQRWLNAAGIR